MTETTNLDALLDEGIDSVFFSDFGTVAIKDETEITVIVERGLEVVDEDGGIDIVSIAILCKPADVDTNDVFVFKDTGQQWVVGRLLLMSPDKRMATYEISAHAGI